MRYRSPDEDSGRWRHFCFRPGDIVISTRSKSGTTWMQMICALLILQTTDLPEPLGRSVARGWTGGGRRWPSVHARLDAQDHRRCHQDAHPARRTAAGPAGHVHRRGPPPSRHGRLSLPSGRQHRSGADCGISPANRNRPNLRHRGRPLHDWLRAWIDGDGSPAEDLDSLPGVAWHATDAWARRHRAACRARPLRRPVGRSGGPDAPAGRPPRHHRAGRQVAGARPGRRLRRDEGRGPADRPRSGRHLDRPGPILPPGIVGGRNRHPVVGRMGPLPGADGHIGPCRCGGVAPSRRGRRLHDPRGHVRAPPGAARPHLRDAPGRFDDVVGLPHLRRPAAP